MPRPAFNLGHWMGEWRARRIRFQYYYKANRDLNRGVTGKNRTVIYYYWTECSYWRRVQILADYKCYLLKLITYSSLCKFACNLHFEIHRKLSMSFYECWLLPNTKISYSGLQTQIRCFVTAIREIGLGLLKVIKVLFGALV
jgi:hypothetical protein